MLCQIALSRGVVAHFPVLRFPELSGIRDAVQILASGQVSGKTWWVLVPARIEEKVLISPGRAIHGGCKAGSRVNAWMVPNREDECRGSGNV